MRPGLIAVGEAHQNGDVESAHNHLVAAIDQGLMLGGSREFGSVEDYENFVAEVVRRRNGGRGERLEQERRVLQRLPAARLPEYEEEEVRVNREAIARVGKQGYSVPARWAGRRLRARISETKIAFYNGADSGRGSRAAPRQPGRLRRLETCIATAFAQAGSFCALETPRAHVPLPNVAGAL